MPTASANPSLPLGLYGITAEKFSCGRSNLEVARAMIQGGVNVIQYREKRTSKSFAEMLSECKALRALTREAGVLLIINDYPTLAQLTDADGVHVGQDDFPVPELRRLLGPNKLIGLSTHDPEQAAAAEKAGADYIGVGPIFSTQTKEDVCAPVGFSYLEHVVNNSPLPFVAIGGVKEHNLPQLIQRGARRAALVTEIVGAADIAATVRRLQQLFPA